MPHIHWTAPTVMVSSLILGTLFALCHHLFYASLDRKHAATSLEGYDVLGTHVSVQQLNTAVGTAFAFLVRACLMLSISIAYFQILIWSVAKHEINGTTLVQMDVMTSALQDLVSLASFRTWFRRPWLWVLAIVAWLLPTASIITPATLSVGIDHPLPIYMNVPNVDFTSLNLAAPMAAYGTTGEEPGVWYMYAGPSLTVQKITDAVAGQGSIIPVIAPSVNSTWDLDFNGPSLHCNPVSSGFRNAVLANILNYTFVRSQQTVLEINCTSGPGYMAWHPAFMNPNKSMTEYLPFNIDDLNSSRGALNNDNSHGYPYSDMTSVFLAIAPTLFSFSSSKDESGPTMCRGKPWYQAGLAQFYNTSTVLRCDVHNSTYYTTFSFVNGVQKVDIKNVTDVTHKPMNTIGQVLAYFNSSNLNDMSLRPQACPPWVMSDSDEWYTACLFDPRVLSTLSYQAVMHAFTDLVAGMISLGDAEDVQTMITSTTQLSSTVLAGAPELAFVLSTQPNVQQRAVTWKQQPFTGLVNAAAGIKATLPFQQALEQLFQNITISLMSAPDLQPNASSIYYPDKTEVHFTTLENIYVYAIDKLWLAYGLAIGVTALTAIFGMAAIIANHGSFSNRFSTILRLSRGAQLSNEIHHADLCGRDPLPAYAEEATVRFPQEQMAGTRDSIAYTLVDRKGENNSVENPVLKNENILEGLLNSPDAPLEQAYLHTNLVASNAGEGRESDWAAQIQHLISSAQAQISTP